MRHFFFDIDGVLLSYEENQRPTLAHGALEGRLKTLEFNRLVCVSGWTDLLNSPSLMIPKNKQMAKIHAMLSDIFPDRDWFLKRLEMAYDTDHRCRHIDPVSEWFYVDDWADKYFSEHFGKKLYEQELGRRILLVNPHGDGGDILKWLDGPVRMTLNQAMPSLPR